MRKLLAALAMLAASGVFSVADAQSYPNRAITLVVPFAAGGPTDTIARIFADRLRQSFGQTVVVESRIGERGGYLVSVTADKEMEDLARPSRVTIGTAVFQESPTVDRQLELVGPATITPGRAWFKIGRDFALEQQILAACTRSN